MKRFKLRTFLPLVSLLLVGCSELFDFTIKVTLHYENGQESDTYIVDRGYDIRKFGKPEKENSVFSAWYYDEELLLKLSSNRVYRSTDLYAAYDLDLELISNKIQSETLSSTITVEVDNQIIDKPYFLTAQGSGVVFYKDTNDYYYALTNNHVTVAPKEYEVMQTLSIRDHDNQSYPALKVHELNTYDLAIVKFYSPKNYHLPKLEEKTIKQNRDVIAIGSPNGQINTVTYGKTLLLDVVGVNEDTYLSNVTFPVLIHTAKIDHGSSGGPLFDYKLDLVGINYASGKSGSKDISITVPTTKVIEYLKLVENEEGVDFGDLT